MFGKKKNQALFNAIDDSRIVVHDFRLRATQAGFESYRTVEYRLYHKLEEAEMMPKLEEHLSKLSPAMSMMPMGTCLMPSSLVRPERPYPILANSITTIWICFVV